MITRRQTLKTLGATGAALATGWPGLTLAAAGPGPRLVVVILRGGLDGLAAVPPYGDPSYTARRGPLAIPAERLRRLDATFALHPSLATFHALYGKGELIAFHAMATPYRERSHFDGQDVLETGLAGPQAGGDGWLNRALGALPDATDREGKSALALGRTVPLILRGATPVASWAPSVLPAGDSDTLARITDMYRHDALFGPALAEGLAADRIARTAMGSADMGKGGRRRGDGARFSVLARAAGALLREPRGPRLAVIETGGWDTHANQGAADGPLARRLAALDAGIKALREALGARWRETAVILVTEFGRTAAANGTMGSDHGTAGAGFLLGGAVNGGRVIADWPGLAPGALYEGRDLRPTLDMRALFKAVLRDHMGIDARALETTVFPDSRQARALDGLIRS